MAQQTINTGTTANDGTGDTMRAAGIKINDNFSELYDRDAVLRVEDFGMSSSATPAQNRTAFLACLAEAATSGIKHILIGGFYELSNIVLIDIDDLLIEGGGYWTGLRLSNGVDMTQSEGFLMIAGSNIGIRNLRVTGNIGAVQQFRGANIHLRPVSDGCYIDTVWSHSARRHGYQVQGQNHRLNNIWTWQNTGYGISFGDDITTLGAKGAKNCSVRGVWSWGSVNRSGIEVADGSDIIRISDFWVGPQANNIRGGIHIRDHGFADEFNQDVKISNGTIDLRTGTPTNGIWIEKTSANAGQFHTDISLSNITIYGANVGVAASDNVVRNMRMSGITVIGPASQGYLIGANTDLKFDNIRVEGSGSHGVQMTQCSGATVTGATVINPTGNGIRANAGDDVSFIDPKCIGGTVGLLWNNGGGATVGATNSRLIGGYLEGTAAALRVGPAADLVIDGTRLGTSPIALDLQGVANNAGCRVFNTKFTGTYATGKVASSADFTPDVWDFKDNPGLLTADRKSATMPSASTTISGIAHGLAITPFAEDFNIQVLADPGNATSFWVSNVTATTFSINCDAAPGADVLLVWRAILRGSRV